VKDQFDVWHYDFPEQGRHPVVLISHPDRCAHAAVVNVLFCTSQRQSRRPWAYEVMLDSADGLDWETLCNCYVMYAVPSSLLLDKIGHVSQPRRQAIRDKIKQLFLLQETN
jgi:mRNA-degrading endonuclease toxin of MazEF toxin-antitoxin module